MQQYNEIGGGEKSKIRKYKIGFNDLPFYPDSAQVIYVESAYNEEVNRFIIEHYERFVAEFRVKNLEFIYLPKCFDAEFEARVRYSVPYTTITEALSSSFMLDYMQRPENRGHITPSLLYSPQCGIDEWVFNGIFIDPHNIDVSDMVKYVDHDIAMHKSSLNSGRSFHIGRYADEEVSEPSVLYDSVGTNVEPAQYIDDDEGDDIRFSIVDDEEDSNLLEMDAETAEIYANIRKYVKLLRLKGIELAVIREFIDKQEPLSPLVITDDLRLFLPMYNNIEIELSPQKKALYFLFLNHPEGIVLQHLDSYHNELINYYKQTNGGVLTSKMEDSIRKLETYGNNQLHVVIARIREAFCLKFDERLARNYFICGEKGGPYRIALNRDMIEWEE